MKAQLLENIGIKLGGKVSGQIKTVCPKCSDDRRNKRDKSLSVDITEGLYNCHHCSWSGKVFEKPKKDYVKPVPRLQKVSDRVAKWFEGRGISNNTLLRFNVTECLEWMPQEEKEVTAICFNYFRDGKLVNIKFRDAKKNFKLSKDSELIFYNLDSIKDEDSCVIVEGEIDAMSLHEAGIYNVVSVPNGASKGSMKLEYLDNCWEYFEGKRKVVLMTDNDAAGLALRDELARRISRERCYKVEYPDGCKDANEVLLKFGKDTLKEIVNDAIEYPVEGVISMDDVFDEVVKLYEEGYPKGTELNIGQLDEYLKFNDSQLTVVTGIPGSGKSEFIDNIAVQAALQHGWRWAVCSFEVQTPIHITKLAEKYTGKAFGFRKNPQDRMSVAQFESAIGFIDKHFYFINIDEVDVTIDGILDKAEELVLRRGVKGLIIDPWNYVEQRRDMQQTETEYISESITKIKRFLRRYSAHGFLIAHPTKLKKENGRYEVPTLYSISGSAHFFNKTDNGMTVYRNFDTNVVEIYVQKVKNYWSGKLGVVTFDYNLETRQYIPI